MALRNALLDLSKECQKTDIIWRNAGYPEVGGYVVKNSNGSFGITVAEKGDNKSIGMAKPDNAIESMHTHPFAVDKGSGTALGVSGQDTLTSMKQGIPAFALDCASGEIYGVTEKGEAIKLLCNESEGTCSILPINDVESDWMFIAGFVPEKRDFSQAIVNKRLNNELAEKGRDENGTTSSSLQPSVPQTYTIDNAAMKAQMSALLENAYQYASGIAAEGGVGAEYQSAVAPVMSQGRAAISAIPDQQTVTVPAGSAQGGGYSSETMDAVGKAFAEQGPCSAGLLLQSLQNQNKK